MLRRTYTTPLLNDRSIIARLDDGHRPKLINQLREALRSRHYSNRTEELYSRWVKRYCRFHKLCHPSEMGEPEINTFPSHLAMKEHVSASTQN